jgi:thiol-disulfide isomerase/thioredoxin
MIIEFLVGEVAVSGCRGSGCCILPENRELRRRFMKKFFWWQVVVLSAAILCPCRAQGDSSSPFDQAVSTYLQSNYKGALQRFQALAKSDPKDARVHYYLALCYQKQRSDKEAVQEYQQALACNKDAAFEEIIKERLARIRKRMSHTISEEEPIPAPASKHAPLRKVIMFTTNWCPACKGFEPTWEAAKKKYLAHLAFEHYNAEDPAAWKIVQQYRPKAYPTFVFLDGSQKVIQKYADAPKQDVFMKQLQDLGAEK